MSESTALRATEVIERTTPSPEEITWLRRCLPIFVQPTIDLKNKNDLVKVFFRFERDGDTGALNCKLCLVYKGESSYNRIYEEQENKLATLCYRSFNRQTYKRTADIDYMEFRQVDLDPNSTTPWRNVFSIDHAGDQKWAQGEKADIWKWFSLMHHYSVEVPYEEWKIEDHSHRPYVYINTSNHLIGEKDNNPQLEKHEWFDYAFEAGDDTDALHYALEHVPTKFNLYSYVCFWKAKNGGRWCDRHQTGELTRTGQSIYIKYDNQ